MEIYSRFVGTETSWELCSISAPRVDVNELSYVRLQIVFPLVVILCTKVLWPFSACTVYACTVFFRELKMVHADDCGRRMAAGEIRN